MMITLLILAQRKSYNYNKDKKARTSDFSEYSPITLAVPSMRKLLFHVTIRRDG